MSKYFNISLVIVQLWKIIKVVLTFPIANKPLSNRSRTPRNRKATPKPANPTPISKKSIIRITTLYVTSCNNKTLLFRLMSPNRSNKVQSNIAIFLFIQGA